VWVLRRFVDTTADVDFAARGKRAGRPAGAVQAAVDVYEVPG
jgi:hypothetical protein